MDVRAEMTISKQEVTRPLTRNIPYRKQEVNKKIKNTKIKSWSSYTF